MEWAETAMQRDLRNVVLINADFRNLLIRLENGATASEVPSTNSRSHLDPVLTRYFLVLS